MNYAEARSYIDNTAKFGMNFGLERVEKILELLGNPQNKVKCIHIGGTNGKGSTTAMITSVLKEQGYKVGMYTSPFLEEFEERIQVNGVNIPKEDLAKVTLIVKGAIDKVVELGFENPTQFEIITSIMFYYFAMEQVDYAVVEVGLGGNLDATNVINPMMVVMASISLDHMNILGDTITEIAGEKAGIIKSNVPVVCYPQVKEALDVIKKKCEEKKNKLYVVSEDCINSVEIDKGLLIQRLIVTVFNETLEIKLPLLGAHQVNNCAVALHALYVLQSVGVEISKESIRNGIAKVRWIGRMEVLNKNPLVVIDGAHNIDGITKLSNSISKYFNYEKLVLIIGMLGDKQVDEMVNEITKEATWVVVTEPHSDRAESSETLYNKVVSKGISCVAIEEYKEAYSKALDMVGSNDLLLICGSLYMIGDMRKAITRG